MKSELKAYIIVFYGGQISTAVATSSKEIFDNNKHVMVCIEQELAEELLAEAKCELAKEQSNEQL